MISEYEFFIRIALAAFLGFVIGFERESKAKPLGVRAFMMIAIGSAGLMMVTVNFALSTIASDPDLQVDPTRVIQGLVGGIGFLGAGAIISNSSSGRLRGVGSGAAIWAVGGIGIACGMGHLFEAGVMAGAIFATLTGFDLLTKKTDAPDGSEERHEDDSERSG